MSKEDMNKNKGDGSSMILGSGIALGALTVAEFALVGAVCPACVVGAPLLVGFGAIKKYQNHKSESSKKNS